MIDLDDIFVLPTDWQWFKFKLVIIHRSDLNQSIYFCLLPMKRGVAWDPCVALVPKGGRGRLLGFNQTVWNSTWAHSPACLTPAVVHLVPPFSRTVWQLLPSLFFSVRCHADPPWEGETTLPKVKQSSGRTIWLMRVPISGHFMFWRVLRCSLNRKREKGSHVSSSSIPSFTVSLFLLLWLVPSQFIDPTSYELQHNLLYGGQRGKERWRRA